MTITETQKTAQLAADAAVSAAEAKQYMLEAEQGYQDTSAAAQQAQDAAGSALLSKQSAATSEENSLQYATEAGVARDEAVTAASNASEYALNKFTFYKTPSDPDGTIAGLAATTTGQSFRVAQGPAGTTAFKTYENQDGVAVLQAAQPGTAAVTGTIREYPTAAAAQADADAGNIQVGAKAQVTNPSDNTLADEYINNAGTMEPTGRKMPSQEAVDAVAAQAQQNADDIAPMKGTIKFSDIGDLVAAIVDVVGFIGWQVDANGGFGSGTAYISPDIMKISGLQLAKSADALLRFTDNNNLFWDAITTDGKGNFQAYNLPNGTSILPTNDAIFRIADPTGLFYDIIDKNGVPAWSNSGGSGEGQTAEQIYINAQDPQNKALVAADSRITLTKLKFPSDAYNHFLGDGQSLMQGDEGWPQVSRTPKYGNLMLGDSVRPAGASSNSFVPLGGSVFKPMIAVTQSIDGAAILSDAETQALDRGAKNEGETPLIGAVNGFRKSFLDAHCLSNDASRLFLSSAVGVSGQILANLVDDAKYYNRVVDCITKAKSIADADGKSYSVTAILFNQGQFDYNAGTTKSVYTSLLTQLRDKVNATVSGITGQTDMPAWFFSQPGYTYSPNPATQPLNAVELWVGMAQWEFCQNTPNCFMVGVDYPLPSKGGHLMPNGYRWMGCYYAKAMDKVLNQRKPFKPLHPIGFYVIGNNLYCNIYVENPPLQLQAPFRIGTRTNIGNRGFRVFSNVQADPSGIGTELTLSSIDIVSDTIVRLTCSSAPEGKVRVSYGTYPNFGQGMLTDSDPYVPDEVYEYDPQFTQWPEENIPELIGKPYPMQNWCIAFAETFTI
ncbi:flagellar biosynthesis, cell-distal portion of basal-body rod [Raoultella terrigena]|uniref:Sialate O-acetylesterase domain-containing protein n=1 Tax=Raoultella terrigena TaxID=577 RepID=A0A7Z8ZA41_RAOTE|nr:hypothetical protein [Raoultella terrigena]VED50045.1 Uncharacterised protein [Raoultella terrigena]VUC80005.1 flagellar biosynthesis, cell-distal portion of basal-body rod [Raoultella terrigena]